MARHPTVQERRKNLPAARSRLARRRTSCRLHNSGRWEYDYRVTSGRLLQSQAGGSIIATRPPHPHHVVSQARRCGHEGRPIVHERATLFERVATSIGGLHRVPNGVKETGHATSKRRPKLSQDLPFSHRLGHDPPGWPAQWKQAPTHAFVVALSPRRMGLPRERFSPLALICRLQNQRSTIATHFISGAHDLNASQAFRKTSCLVEAAHRASALLTAIAPRGGFFMPG